MNRRIAQIAHRMFTHAGLIALFGCGICEAETLSVSTYGGDTATGIRKSMVDPAAARLGLTVRFESLQSGLPTVRLQVASRQPTWDVVVLGSDECAAGSNEGLFEELDYSIIKAEGLPPEAINPHWIGEAYYSTVLAWRTEKYKSNPPKNWRDFWDTKTFPGRRSLPAWASDSLPIAVMAGGIAPADVYPLNTALAFSKLRQIKPSVDVWWNSGGQSAQLLKDGEVDMMAIWASRIPALIADGVQISFTYDQGVMAMSCLAIVKGSKHVAAAQKLISIAISTEQQSTIPLQWLMYGPTNRKSFEQMKYSSDVLARTNSAPANAAKQSLLSATWWAKNAASVEQPFKTLISE
jgi:putative spermidine/putrescine transport system substrate-binding protein